MDTAVQVLEKMEGVLDELVRTAEGLKDLSFERFSEKAVVPLQQKQELLVQQLKEFEKAFESSNKEGLEGPLAKIGDRISKKLRYFQHLNAVFIGNISQGNVADYWRSKIPVDEMSVLGKKKRKTA